MQAFLRQMIQILALHAFENHEYSHLFACFLVCSPVSELFGRHYLLFNLRNLLYLIGRDVVSIKRPATEIHLQQALTVPICFYGFSRQAKSRPPLPC